MRHAVFTWNNYPDKGIEMLEAQLPPHSYLIVGREVGESGTPHLQGYVEFKSQAAFSTLKRKFPEVHWEKRMGNAQQASDYCRKEGTVYESGTISVGQGRRTDLEALAEAVRDGMSISEVAQTDPVNFVKYSRGLQALADTVQVHRTEPPVVTWLWGMSGTGKTRTAVNAHPPAYIKDGTQWWNNYVQQPSIVVDDFDGQWPYRDLLRFLDRYEYQGQVKGGYVKINSPHIYITCEFPPDKFWSGNQLDQILRRINHIIELKKTD